MPDLTPYEPNIHRMENLGPLDMVTPGQYWWVESRNYKGEPQGKFLMCCGHVGSNHVTFRGKRTRHSRHCETVHFDDFEERCQHEPNAMEILNRQASEIQEKIQCKMDELQDAGRRLCLIQGGGAEIRDESQSSALVPSTKDPKEYKNELIEFRDNLPEKHKEIDELSQELTGTFGLMMASQETDVVRLKGALDVVGDRIFTMELYCGLLEDVILIKDGKPASRDERIAIRQQMLFMDEETLFDYRSGGMDFNSLKKFDEWVAQPENLDRVLPEKRGIVAFRVRRYAKQYGSNISIWTKVWWDKANMATYLLIRNGEKVYRVAPEIDFSPRLVPFRNEFDGEKRFRKKRGRTVSLHPGDEGFNPEHKPGFPFNTRHETYYEEIGPNHLDYDRYVKELERSIKHYNRMIVLIQGLLDRSEIFCPHPGIKLSEPGQIDKWVNLIRDEEDVIADESADLGDWFASNNDGTHKGQWIYSNVRDPAAKGRGYDANARPRVIQVSGVKRDNSAVKVSWPWGSRWGYEHGNWGAYGEWPVDRMCHQWIPVGKFVNLNHYQLDEYKTFLCDRALKGRYLVWADYLLSAEDWKRQQIIDGKDITEATASQGRINKVRVKKVVLELEEESEW